MRQRQRLIDIFGQVFCIFWSLFKACACAHQGVLEQGPLVCASQWEGARRGVTLRSALDMQSSMLPPPLHIGQDKYEDQDQD